MAARRRRVSVGLGLAVAAILAPAAFAAGSTRPATSEACPTRGEETALVAAVEARLELRLADGRLARLAGLDPALSTPREPDGDENAQATLAAHLDRHRLTLTVLDTAPDRWGRLVVFAFDAEGAATPGGLTADIIAMGLGRYRAEPAATPCRASFVEVEERARAARLGLWDDPYYAVLAVDDQAGFAERAGSMVLVQGKVTKVMEGPYRETLVFGEGTTRFSATATPRVKKTLEARGLRSSMLKGRSVRLRGLLDLRFGPRMELAGPDDIEMIDDVAPSANASVGSR